ncbi:SRPBCC family protein [Emticicia agri]|uniref:ATPase n=1 Tax=Emticicia agri TaxID=2492393 RepID=A0A4V1ZDJ3_9BACT|nr:SRPBCC family protein [Emticicia agri]RYU96360.1 ATPase [Emticicia agri]
MSTTKNSRYIKATPEVLYQAFTEPKALETWMAPGEMTGKMHSFDLREGGSYEMSLYYPESEKQTQGKSSNKEDRYKARFVELTPNKKIVQAITFDSTDENLTGEMIMEVTFTKKDKGTEVSIIFKNIPPGIKPEDNEQGTEMTLEKLAKYVE